MAEYQLQPVYQDLEALVEGMVAKMSQDAYTNPVTDNFPWILYANTVAESLSEESHERVAVLWNNLATVYKDLGDYEQARGLFKKAFNSLKLSLGEHHPNTQVVKQWLDSMEKK